MCPHAIRPIHAWGESTVTTLRSFSAPYIRASSRRTSNSSRSRSRASIEPPALGLAEHLLPEVVVAEVVRRDGLHRHRQVEHPLGPRVDGRVVADPFPALLQQRHDVDGVEEVIANDAFRML